jgi:catechol 2,3-dioxygenase-like lactoylglutathione lyase family enzyme
MTEHDFQGAAKPLLLRATPQLFVADLPVSCDFFTSKLGFTVDFTYGEPPFYGQVARDGARLALRQVDRPILAGINAAMAAEPDMLAATITVDDVKALYLEFKANGAPFHQALRLEPWGARTCIVRDLDGNLLLFAGD